MLSNGGLAGMLGRTDLSPVAPSSTPQDPYAYGVRRVQMFGEASAAPASLDQGRIATAGLIVIVLGAGAFYLWTRGHQEHHFHTGVDSIALYGLSAILVINLVRIGAGKLAAQPGWLGDLGAGVGGLVHFGS